MSPKMCSTRADMRRSGFRFTSNTNNTGGGPSPMKPEGPIAVDLTARLSSSQKSVSTSLPGSSGYSADSEKTAFMGDPPVSIDLLPKHKKRPAQSPPVTDELTRRAKIQEINYVAATAKAELARHGFDPPALPKTTLEFFPKDSKIDMTRVDHVYSTTIPDPGILFLGPEEFAIATHDAPAYAFIHTEENLPLLLKSCKHFYQEKKNPSLEASSKQESSNSESSTSSVTSDDPEGSAESSPEEDVAPIFASIGDALSLSKEARIVTLSDEPFMVVHVNAAFSRLTGLSSIRIQGKHLRDLIEGEDLLKALRTSSTSRITTMMRLKQCKNHMGPPTDLKNRSVYKVVVSPVGAPERSPTHVVIGLTDCRSFRA